MKAPLVDLGTADRKAKDFFLESLGVCAHDHILSRKLLERFSVVGGLMQAILPPKLDLDALEVYDWYVEKEAERCSEEVVERPVLRLMEYVQEYLRPNAGRVVVCENWGWTRSRIAGHPWLPPRLAFFGDNEVLHILTPDITDPDQIEATVADRHHWQTGVCSSCEHLPDDEIDDESFFDEIVRNTQHLFIPAFDGTGYLIWSPILSEGSNQPRGNSS